MADDLSHELKAMKNFVATMGAMHDKQIKAVHVDNIFLEYWQGGLPVLVTPITRNILRRVPAVSKTYVAYQI